MNSDEIIKHKKIIIWGTGKYQRDFEAIFNDLEVIYYITSEITTDTINDKKVYSIDYLKNEEMSDKLIIVCSSSYDEISKSLFAIGLIENKDFILASSLFYLLDKPFNIVNRSLVIWGTGPVCESFIKNFSISNVEYFVDFEEKKDLFYEREIRYYKSLEKDKGKNYIIIATDMYTVAKEYLISIGMEESLDFASYKLFNVDKLPSKLLMRTINDKVKTDFYCRVPFEHVEINGHGEVSTCCPGWIESIKIGNILTDEFSDIWNSNIAKIIRLSILNGTYTFCSKKHCNFLNDGESYSFVKKSDKKISQITSMSQEINLDKYPYSFAIGHDPRCNLKCKSCRSEFKEINDEQLKIINHIQEKVSKSILPYVDNIAFSTSGDALFSEESKKFVFDDIYKNKKENSIFRLQTNGILFNEENWEKIKDKYENLYLYVSIDAATKNTYKKLRGGNFDILVKNMKFAGDLRRQNKIQLMGFNFVVQKDNYKEMVEFVELGLDIGVDTIYFSKLNNWGTFEKNQYYEKCIFDENHEEFSEFIESFKNPIFNNSIVDLGNLKTIHNRYCI